MPHPVNAGNTYGSYLGLMQQAVGPIYWGGRTVPSVVLPTSGAVELYEVETVVVNGSTTLQLRDTGQQVLAYNTLPYPVLANTYVSLALQSQQASEEGGATYAIVQCLAGGPAAGRPINLGCPAVGRVLLAEIIWTDPIPNALVGLAFLSWAPLAVPLGTPGTACYVGGAALSLVEPNTLGGFTAVMNLVLSVVNDTLELSAQVLPPLPTITASTQPPIDRFGVGVVAQGGGSGSNQDGGGGAGGAFGYVPVTPGNEYTPQYSRNPYSPNVAALSLSMPGDDSSYVAAYPGYDADPVLGTNAGQGGTGEINNVLGAPTENPQAVVSGTFTGGKGALGSSSPTGVGAGGGSGGCGANGGDALGTLFGVGGYGSDGQQSFQPFPAGGDGASPVGNGQSPGGGASGKPPEGDPIELLGGNAQLVLYQGCASFQFVQPNGITGYIKDPSALIIDFAYCSCDPFELVYFVTDPDPCALMHHFTILIGDYVPSA